MAHTCPDCGQTCYCGGDIDDCCFDFPEDVMRCTHCDGTEEDNDDICDGLEEDTQIKGNHSKEC